MIQPVRSLAMFVMLGMMLSACGEKESNTRAAVVVNGESLAAVELEDKLTQYAHFSEQQKKSVTGKLLSGMVDTELLRQAAINDRLDQDETIRARLAAANRLILANAFLEKQAALVGKPAEAEIKAYFDQHPELFAERKVYELDEMLIEVRPADAAEVKARFGDGSNHEAFVKWLAASKIPHESQTLSASPEDMRPEILDKIKAGTVGTAYLLQGTDRVSVLHIKALHPQPRALDKATPMIETKLMEQRKTKHVKEVFEKLRKQAKIQYLEPYTDPGIAAHDQK